MHALYCGFGWKNVAKPKPGPSLMGLLAGVRVWQKSSPFPSTSWPGPATRWKMKGLMFAQGEVFVMLQRVR